MAIEVPVQRLEIGDVVLIDLPGLERQVEATVVRDIDRTDTTVLVTLRVPGREDFAQEWRIGDMVTVVRVHELHPGAEPGRMSWGDAELLLIALAAMLSPTTLSFSVLALVLGERPLRTGVWFYLGALSAMLAIGVVAAFVLGNVAASPTSTPKTWVAIVDVIAGALLLVYVVRLVRRPADPEKAAGMVARMGKVASSPAVAIFGAGAVLANAGGFIPLALKAISEKNPSATAYIGYWVAFTLVSLLPLGIAIVMLLVARDWTVKVLNLARDWLVLHARMVAAVIVALLAVVLLRNGIAGLT